MNWTIWRIRRRFFQPFNRSFNLRKSFPDILNLRMAGGLAVIDFYNLLFFWYRNDALRSDVTKIRKDLNESEWKGFGRESFSFWQCSFAYQTSGKNIASKMFQVCYFNQLLFSCNERTKWTLAKDQGVEFWKKKNLNLDGKSFQVSMQKLHQHQLTHQQT